MMFQTLTITTSSPKCLLLLGTVETHLDSGGTISVLDLHVTSSIAFYSSSGAQQR